eukprot:2207783-Pleurochrysis_carterae.AAC.1
MQPHDDIISGLSTSPHSHRPDVRATIADMIFNKFGSIINALYTPASCELNWNKPPTYHLPTRARQGDTCILPTQLSALR